MIENDIFRYDVFISHNSKDKSDIIDLVKKLKSRDLRVWFDKDLMAGGDSTFDKLTEAVEFSRTYAILVGKNGLGQYQKQEMAACLRKSMEENKKTMAVLLPGYPKDYKLNPFLENYTRIDLQSGFDTDEFERFINSILKGKPKRQIRDNLNRDNNKIAGVNKENTEGDSLRKDLYSNGITSSNSNFYTKNQNTISKSTGQNSIPTENSKNKHFLGWIGVATAFVGGLVFIVSILQNPNPDNPGPEPAQPHQVKQWIVVDPPGADLFITINSGKEYQCPKPCSVSAPIDTQIKWRAVLKNYWEQSSYFRMGETIPTIYLDPKE